MNCPLLWAALQFVNKIEEERTTPGRAMEIYERIILKFSRSKTIGFWQSSHSEMSTWSSFVLFVRGRMTVKFSDYSLSLWCSNTSGTNRRWTRLWLKEAICLTNEPSCIRDKHSHVKPKVLWLQVFRIHFPPLHIAHTPKKTIFF